MSGGFIVRLGSVGALLTAVLFMAQCTSIGGAAGSGATGGKYTQQHRIGGACTYTSYPGTAIITSIHKLESEPYPGGPPYQGYRVTFAFSSEGESANIPARIEAESHTLQLKNSWPLGPRFIEKYGIEVGRAFDCVLKVIQSGTCSPILFEFPQIDLADYFEAE